MLTRLGIRDVVLIDRLDLEVAPGLSVLTGETGAGKSILLDALGLALGARADSSLIRHGAGPAIVTAEFELPDGHPAWALLREQGIDAEDGQILLRRTLGIDGRGRASVNDQSVSVGFLRNLGAALVEIQGQFDQHALMDPANHRAILDQFGGLLDSVGGVRAAYRLWQAARDSRQSAESALERARTQEEYLRHVVAELQQLAPEPGEESELADRRARLQNRAKLLSTLQSALNDLAGENGAEMRLLAASRTLSRAPGQDPAIDTIITALERASNELAEATDGLESLMRADGWSEGELERIEDRLFSLRAAARKHQVTAEALPGLAEKLSADLAALDAGEGRLKALQEEERLTRAAYLEAATALTAYRQEAAGRLAAHVTAELVPLKLDKARITVEVAPQPEGAWGPEGRDKVGFLIATNPGATPGPLAKVASGGELSRFLLALKVVLAGTSPVPTLVFDEVDSGIGGAVAAAVGERLKRLGDHLQVLVITHSPQVAALGAHHWRVQKRQASPDARVTTSIDLLPLDARREEIARMLSGADITNEARAAADRLLG
jgi:DNA repair protein RecN (Recombination protein N)